jgi:hypothetical protein
LTIGPSRNAGEFAKVRGPAKEYNKYRKKRDKREVPNEKMQDRKMRDETTS